MCVNKNGKYKEPDLKNIKYLMQIRDPKMGLKLGFIEGLIRSQGFCSQKCALNWLANNEVKLIFLEQTNDGIYPIHFQR